MGAGEEKGRLKVEKWQKSRGDWENGHGFATDGQWGNWGGEVGWDVRRGKCWQLLSAFCSCPAGRLETAAAVQLDS